MKQEEITWQSKRSKVVESPRSLIRQRPKVFRLSRTRANYSFAKLYHDVHRIRNRWNSRNSRCSGLCIQRERPNERKFRWTPWNFLVPVQNTDRRLLYRCSFQGWLNGEKDWQTTAYGARLRSFGTQIARLELFMKNSRIPTDRFRPKRNYVWTTKEIGWKYCCGF